jgi:Glycosyl transferase family 2/Methyltransferase domain
MESIPGVLTRAEGDLLLAAWRALAVLPPPHEIFLTGRSCDRARFILATATKALDADATVSIVGQDTAVPSQDSATAPLVVAGGGVDEFATAVEEFLAAAQRQVAGGLLAWRSPRSAGLGEQLTEALVRLGVLTRLGEAGSMSILQPTRRLTLPSLRDTLDRFRSAITEAGLEDVVEVVEGSTESLDWAERPVAALLVDGLHDYASVSRDFSTLADDVVEGGLAAFHDCADYYPGVQALVGELQATAGWRLIAAVGTLMLFQRTAPQDTPVSVRSESTAVSAAPMPSRPPLETVHDGNVRPLVSCIMPTKNRPTFVTLAINYFLRQDYPSKELIIVDDGDESIEHLVPTDDRIRTRAGGSIGGNRNLACGLAAGELIAQWDDGDWYAPTRLSHQVQALQTGVCDVVGANQLLYWAPEAGQVCQYAYPAAGRPGLHDPTLCYPRALWSAQPFSPANHALDCEWLWSGPHKRLRSLDADPPLYVGIIHAANTRTKATEEARWIPASIERLIEVIGADRARYLTGVL